MTAAVIQDRLRAKGGPAGQKVEVSASPILNYPLGWQSSAKWFQGAWAGRLHIVLCLRRIIGRQQARVGIVGYDMIHNSRCGPATKVDFPLHPNKSFFAGRDRRRLFSGPTL